MATARPADTQTIKHRVTYGETIRLISRRYFGTKRHWKRIYLDNLKVVGNNSNVIHPGMVLTVRLATQPKHVSQPKPNIPLPPRLPSPAPTPVPTAVVPSPLPEPSVDPTPALPEPTPTPEPVVFATIAPTPAPVGLTPYLPAAASLVIPGSAQIVRGDWDRGFSHLGLSAVSVTAMQVGYQHADPSLQWAGGIGLVGISLWSAWDAYQHAASVTKP